MNARAPRPAEVNGGITAAGLVAFGSHMHTHGLPAPFSVDIDTTHGVVVLSAHIYGPHLDRWLDTATAITVVSADRHPSGWITTVYDVALDCGTRIQLRGQTYDVPDSPAGLTVVPTQPGGDQA